MYNDTCNYLVNTIFPLSNEVVGDGIEVPFDVLVEYDIDQDCLRGDLEHWEDYDTRYETGWTHSEGPWGPEECPDDWDLPWAEWCDCEE